MRDLFLMTLVALLIFFVALSQVAAAVLPLIIIVKLVPPGDRAELADLVSAISRGRGLGMRAVVRVALAARAARERRGRCDVVDSDDRALPR